ncbi:hypothetical protein L1276_002069 [Flavobacterium sp. HSC-32F16]|uniref:energy transducer TonB n=1 Tax=Flavobacterium sp. HSC-32F16 TaxID=2910964 RepID=UPI0020A56960|nr:energy transducer TonB [Flavobacterium sp. HSC-32F16]MCP2026925.1 hypothetical protein [Flavobacterium sp. HSC-32F16]
MERNYKISITKPCHKEWNKIIPDEIQPFFIQNQYYKIFSLVWFIAMGITLYSCQNKDEKKTKIDKIEVIDEPKTKKPIDYDAVFEPASLDIMPAPEDGLKNLYNFIYSNYVVPDGAEEYAGKVKISFIIEKDGSLSTFKIKRDFGFGTGMEAVRVLKKSPKWIPGKLNGKIVRTSYILPITIK